MLETTLVLPKSLRSISLTLPILLVGLSKSWDIIFFNCDKKDHDATKCPSQKRTVISQKTSDNLGDPS